MIDDVPVAEPDTRTVRVGTLQMVDVQLIVDISGSMGDDVDDVADFSDNRTGLARFRCGVPHGNIEIENVESCSSTTTPTASPG